MFALATKLYPCLVSITNILRLDRLMPTESNG